MPRQISDPALEARGMVRVSNGFLGGTTVMRQEKWKRMERNRKAAETRARNQKRIKERLKRAARKRARKLAGNARKARLKDPKHCRHKRERTVQKFWSGRKVRKCTNCGRERKA